MDTNQFLLDKFKEQWRLFGRILVDLTESYQTCNLTELSLNEWNQAMKELDQDFISLQDCFEMLTSINTLHKAYSDSIADKGADGGE